MIEIILLLIFGMFAMFSSMLIKEQRKYDEKGDNKK